jgi:hypothetical protein
MWNVKTKVIPAVMGATGTITNSFTKYLSNIQESGKLRNCRKQPYLTMHTKC